MTLLINTEEARRVLTMDDCLEYLDAAYKDLANKEAVTAPPGGRWDVWWPIGDEKFYVFGSLQGRSRRLECSRSGSSPDIMHYPWEPTARRWTSTASMPGKYCGLIMLFSVWNAELLAILNDGHIQHMRVGATAGVAANYMARENAVSVGMFGSGGMARTYLEAFSKVRRIDYCRVYSPTRAHREAYAAEMSDKLDINVVAVDSPELVTEGADIVAGCTDSTQPVIHPQYLAPGMHVTPVVTRELPQESVEKFDVIVRHNNGGAEGFFVGGDEDYTGLPEGHFDGSYRGVNRGDLPTLADLVSGKARGRTSDDQLTCYYNVPGSGLQFAAVAYRVYELAKARRVGAGAADRVVPAGRARLGPHALPIRQADG